MEENVVFEGVEICVPASLVANGLDLGIHGFRRQQLLESAIRMPLNAPCMLCDHLSDLVHGLHAGVQYVLGPHLQGQASELGAIAHPHRAQRLLESPGLGALVVNRPGN